MSKNNWEPRLPQVYKTDAGRRYWQAVLREGRKRWGSRWNCLTRDHRQRLMRLKAQGHDFHFVTGNEEDDDAVSAWDRIQDRCRCLEHDLADLRVAAEKAEAEAEQVEAERPGIELAAVLMRAEAAARKRAEQERVAELARQKVEEAAQRTKVVEKLERQPSEPHVPRLRDANDVARIEEARKLYARGNISKTAAVKEVLAPGSTGRIPKDLMTHINRLRKKI